METETEHAKTTPKAGIAVIFIAALLSAILYLSAVRARWLRLKEVTPSPPWEFVWFIPIGATRSEDVDALSYEQGKKMGRDDAMRDLASGVLACEGWDGMGNASASRAFQILSEEYHIHYRSVFDCLNHSAGQFGHASGYNETMTQVIEKRFGKGLFEKVLRKAENGEPIQQTR